jgi:hypothetical protein
MAANILAWTLYVVTPLSVLLFLVTFLVNLYGDDEFHPFKRFCRRAQLPAFGLVLVCVLLTVRYF